MKLIKGLACLMLGSVATVSAMEFVGGHADGENAGGGKTFSKATGGAGSSSLVQDALMISTENFPLFAKEVAALSLSSIISTLNDEETTESVMQAIYTFGSGNIDSGVAILSGITFTEINSNNPISASKIRDSISSLFTAADGTPINTAYGFSWKISSDGIVQSVGVEQTEDTTFLTLGAGQKLLIELARETPELTQQDGTKISTLSMLAYDAHTAYSILSNSCGDEVGSITYNCLQTLLREEVKSIFSAMTSTDNFLLTPTEAATLSISRIINTLRDDATIGSVRQVMQVFSSGDITSGVSTLSEITFTEENSSDVSFATRVRDSISDLFTADGTLTSSWHVSADGIVKHFEVDAVGTTVLHLTSTQKLLIEFARQTPEFITPRGDTLITLSLLGFEATAAHDLLVAYSEGKAAEGTGSTTYNDLLKALSFLTEEVAGGGSIQDLSTSLMASSLIRTSSGVTAWKEASTTVIGTIVIPTAEGDEVHSEGNVEEDTADLVADFDA